MKEDRKGKKRLRALIWGTDYLKTTEKLVLFRLAEVERDLRCEASTQELAFCCGLSDGATRRVLRRLCALGALKAAPSNRDARRVCYEISVDGIRSLASLWAVEEPEIDGVTPPPVLLARRVRTK